VDAGSFRLVLDLEVRKAQRLRYCLCVVRLKGRLPESREMPCPSMVKIFASRIRATDIATERGADDVALLLVDADITALPSILRRIIADFEDVPWSAGAASYPKSASGADDLLEQAERMLVDAKGNGGSDSGPRR